MDADPQPPAGDPAPGTPDGVGEAAHEGAAGETPAPDGDSRVPRWPISAHLPAAPRRTTPPAAGPLATPAADPLATPAAGDPHAPGRAAGGAAPPRTGDPGDPVPLWLRSGAAIAGRLLVIAAAVAVAAYALAYLRVVVLPVIVALLLSTVLRPPTRWLMRHRFPDSAAAGTVLLSAVAVLAFAVTLAGAAIGRQFSDLVDNIQDGVREAGEALERPPFNLSEADIQQSIDNGLDTLSESSGSLTGGALQGAVLVGEVLTGLVITLLLLFFFLKDGPGMWRWVVRTFGGRQRTRLDEMAHRCYGALAGYVRGLALVGVADAALIGSGLLILGVPLVGPLMLLTFLAAFLPLIGAFSAGLAAVLIALVDGGVVTALIVFALVLAVQQLEGHVLYPLIMGRTVSVHPIAIILGLATGGILAGIIGVFISVPIVTVAATALTYLRETREPPPPELATAGAATS